MKHGICLNMLMKIIPWLPKFFGLDSCKEAQREKRDCKCIWQETIHKPHHRGKLTRIQEAKFDRQEITDTEKVRGRRHDYGSNDDKKDEVGFKSTTNFFLSLMRKGQCKQLLKPSPQKEVGERFFRVKHPQAVISLMLIAACFFGHLSLGVSGGNARSKGLFEGFYAIEKIYVCDRDQMSESGNEELNKLSKLRHKAYSGYVTAFQLCYGPVS
ncbi:unnamed protein product [Gongylonema pulchrum]|uniref:Uncharacterized protein n=1 Tax=Gongylonema pulchrum TaxID=637853 RepID=A0A183DZA6_9BILA|nr:unnamed protein product [Gongylonema pulchrum]